MTRRRTWPQWAYLSTPPSCCPRPSTPWSTRGTSPSWASTPPRRGPAPPYWLAWRRASGQRWYNFKWRIKKWGKLDWILPIALYTACHILSFSFRWLLSVECWPLLETFPVGSNYLQGFFKRMTFKVVLIYIQWIFLILLYIQWPITLIWNSYHKS